VPDDLLVRDTVVKVAGSGEEPVENETLKVV
jgi:hypothetical protein